MSELARELLAWAATVAGAGAQVVGSASLSQGGGGGPWRLRFEGGGLDRAVLYAGDPADGEVRGRFATEAAALELAGRHGLAAPRLIAADLDGRACGHLALLTTVLDGSSRIPVDLAPERLRALGRALATIHEVTVPPSDALPLRDQPLAGAGFETMEVPARSAALFAQARALAASRAGRERGEPHVFVHGDFWQGNTLWDGERYQGAVDWDFAGVGPAGVDLGSLRCDVAVLHGPEAAGPVLEGWLQAGGDTDVAWWDLVSGLSTPPDLGAWLPNFHAQGRTDLDLDTVTRRRDGFLAAALRALG